MVPYCQKANTKPAPHRSQKTISQLIGTFRMIAPGPGSAPVVAQPLIWINRRVSVQVVRW
jgi:hypothetical protein